MGKVLSFRFEKLKKLKKDFILYGVFIFAVLVIACFFLTTGKPEAEEVPCELIEEPVIQEEPAEIAARVCEIIDLQGNTIESFYGSFTCTNGDTWGRVEYREKGWTKIYLIVPGGKVRVYALKDEE